MLVKEQELQDKIVKKKKRWKKGLSIDREKTMCGR